MRKYLKILLLLALVPLATTSAQAKSPGGGANPQATGGGDCQLCFDYGGGGGISGPSGGGHGFSSRPCGVAGPTGDAYCMDCHAFNACHSGTQYLQGGCRSWHWYCGLNHAFLDEVKAAGEQGVVFASRDAGQGSAALSPSGEYLLVRNCERVLVAAFRISRLESLPLRPLSRLRT
jgi:hypothetical protein